MDPLSQMIALLKPQAVFWRMVEAHGNWTIRFLPSELVVFGQLLEGCVHLERDDGMALDFAPGDFLLMAAPPPYTISAGGGGDPVDFGALIADPDLLPGAGKHPGRTRFIAANFSFAPENAGLVASLMPDVICVRATDPAVERLGGLVTAVGAEALADRPGRALILDRLLEVLLIEALRYRSQPRPGPQRGLLAGLTDAKVGRALRIMHADARRPWTVAALAGAVGMSRSAFAARFTQIIGLSPIDYLANWRMTLAKSALASSSLAMTEIAEIAGYQSVSAFSTGFKRATGFSPRFYARSLAN